MIKQPNHFVDFKICLSFMKGSQIFLVFVSRHKLHGIMGYGKSQFSWNNYVSLVTVTPPVSLEA